MSNYTRHVLGIKQTVLFFTMMGLLGLSWSAMALRIPYTAVSISATDTHACAVLDSGKIKCWGENSNGQLGNGTTVDSLMPVLVSGISTGGSVSVGFNHSCAVLNTGNIRCWGRNDKGQLGNETTSDSATPVAVSGISTAVSVSAGNRHTCALLSDGSIRCWGYNNYGQLGNGEVLSSSSKPVEVVYIDAAESISAGDSYSCAALTDKTINCWGFNGSGQLGRGTTSSGAHTPTPDMVIGISTATSVSTGRFHTCATLSDNTVKCWGYNSNGQLGDGTTDDSATPVTASSISTAEPVSVGYTSGHTCAVLSDGTIECWGENSYGQLGDGTDTDSTTPVTVNGVSTAALVDAANYYTCTLLSDGTVKCWGYNSNGQLGDGTTDDSLTPVKVKL